MADKKITQLNNITGANLAEADEFVVVDITADETKAITFSELKTAFDTSTGFVRITGDTMTGNLSFGDNDKALFGAGSDLQIYSDGSYSYLQEGSGTSGIRITSDNQVAIRKHDNEDIAVFNIDGAVRFYHDNAQKFSTTSTGIDVTGTLTSDGLTVTGSTGSVATVRLQAEELHADIVSVNEGVNYGGVKIKTNSNGTLKDRLKIESNGDISFYEDTGTTAKFFWDASAERLGLGTTSPSDSLHIYDSSGGATLKIESNTANAYDSSKLELLGGNLSVSEILFGDATDNDVGKIIYRHDGNSLSFNVNAAERMRIDSSGRVGIGTSAVGTLLHVSNGVTNNIANDTSEVRFIGTDKPLNLEHANLVIQTNDNMAINKGGSIAFGGRSTTGSINSNNFAHIGGRKENATSGNYAGYLSFGTSDSISDIHERMRIDSSGNVGIGVSPSSGVQLKVGNSANNSAVSRITNGTVSVDLTASGSGLAFLEVGTNHPLVISTNATERMRIDSSGNLLVGKTTSDFNTQGNNLKAGGHFVFDGNSALYLNRLSSDGSILALYKDGSLTGSIGTNGSYPYIGSHGTSGKGIKITDALLPATNSGAFNDANVNLGASNVRWKDLYLSGGVDFGGAVNSGGVVSSSNKLDDYEEGTWTPILKDGAGSTRTLSFAAGRYTIIGRIVHVQANITRNDYGGTNGNLTIGGLPFTSTGSGGAPFLKGAMWLDNGGPSTGLNDSVGVCYLGTSSTSVFGLKTTNQGQNADTRYFQYQHLTNGRPIYLDFTYII